MVSGAGRLCHLRPPSLARKQELRCHSTSANYLQHKFMVVAPPSSAAQPHDGDLQFHTFQIPAVPDIFYIPEYLSSVEEASYLTHANASKSKWVELSGRRCQNLGGSVHEKGLIPTPLPSWVQPLMSRLHRDTTPIDLFGPAEPNHALVNAYRPGEGIMPHEDGPAYHPGVCIISLGAPAVIRFREKPPQQAAQHGAPGPDAKLAPRAAALVSLLLMPRSLIVFKGDAYTRFTHGIDEVLEERIDSSVCNLHLCPTELAHLPGGMLPRGTDRVSLTVRRVPRVIKGFMQLGGRGR